MTDRELLEAAAKAAGVQITHWHADGYPVALIPDRGLWGWNPLEDDGDALRLAVKLGILNLDDALFYGDGTIDFQDDPYAATRRAIVRAAAEIGRSE